MASLFILFVRSWVRPLTRFNSNLADEQRAAKSLPSPKRAQREIGTWKSVAPRHPSNSVRSHTLWRSSASWIAMISWMNCQVFKLRLSGIYCGSSYFVAIKVSKVAEIQYLISSGSDTAQTKKKRSKISSTLVQTDSTKEHSITNTSLHS